MKSLERRFNNLSQLNFYWSSYICFVEAIKNQNFSRRIILLYFNKLVKKDDYDRADKKEIIKNLISLSSNFRNSAEESMF